jgi:hypothetical protein
VELSNRDLIGRGFELLAEGLEPFVDHHMAGVAPGGMDWFDWMSGRKENRGMTMNRTDPLVLLRVITRQEAVFKDTLSRAERSYVQELWDCRNDWAHNSKFNEADTHRLLDSINRLLRAVGAATEADQVQRLLRDHTRPAPQMPSQRASQGSSGRQETPAAGATPGSASDGSPPHSGSFLPPGTTAAGLVLLTVTFAALETIGLSTLPSATNGEKALITGTCLALSASAFAAVGAWHSKPRFTAMAIAAGVAIVCLGSLSVTAGSVSREQSRAARNVPSLSSTDQERSTSAAKSSNPASPTPSVSSRQGPDATQQYLANLSVSTNTDQPQDNSWTMEGRTYADSIGYPEVGEEESATYKLTGRFRSFLVTVGVNDDANPMDQGIDIEFAVYANPGGGAITELSDTTAQWGHTKSINVNIAGATTLTLTTSSPSGLTSPDSVAVWGTPRLKSSL